MKFIKLTGILGNGIIIKTESICDCMENKEKERTEITTIDGKIYYVKNTVDEIYNLL